MVTNQEFKRAFTGDMGPLAGAPLAGIVEQDPEDKYGLAKELIHPLKPWFEETDGAVEGQEEVAGIESASSS